MEKLTGSIITHLNTGRRRLEKYRMLEDFCMPDLRFITPMDNDSVKIFHHDISIPLEYEQLKNTIQEFQESKCCFDFNVEQTYNYALLKINRLYIYITFAWQLTPYLQINTDLQRKRKEDIKNLAYVDNNISYRDLRLYKYHPDTKPKEHNFYTATYFSPISFTENTYKIFDTIELLEKEIKNLETTEEDVLYVYSKKEKTTPIVVNYKEPVLNKGFFKNTISEITHTKLKQSESSEIDYKRKLSYHKKLKEEKDNLNTYLQKNLYQENKNIINTFSINMLKEIHYIVENNLCAPNEYSLFCLTFLK